MTTLIGRRGFLTGLAAAFAAPALVRVESLMPVRGLIMSTAPSSNALLTINMITREAITLFVNTNLFLHQINKQYGTEFEAAGTRVGDHVRIYLPPKFDIAAA